MTSPGPIRFAGTTLGTIPVATAGTITVLNGSQADTVDYQLDVQGYYTAPSGNDPAGLLTPVAPTRLADTNCATTPTLADCTAISTLSSANGTLSGVPAGNHDTVAIGGVGSALVPSSATAVVANLTAAAPAKGGFLTVNPATTPPSTSDVNFATGTTVANMVIGGLDSLGDVVVYNSASAPVNMILDVSGYFGAAV